MKPIRFYTEKLTIRQFCEKDAESYFELLAYPKVNCFVREKVGSIEIVKDKIDEIKEKPDGSELFIGYSDF